MLKDGTIHSITAKVTDEKRGAPEGVWVQGGGMELPCKYCLRTEGIQDVSEEQTA